MISTSMSPGLFFLCGLFMSHHLGKCVLTLDLYPNLHFLGAFFRIENQ